MSSNQYLANVEVSWVLLLSSFFVVRLHVAGWNCQQDSSHIVLSTTFSWRMEMWLTVLTITGFLCICFLCFPSSKPRSTILSAWYNSRHLLGFLSPLHQATKNKPLEFVESQLHREFVIKILFRISDPNLFNLYNSQLETHSRGASSMTT